jgi:hypothetical protein
MDDLVDLREWCKAEKKSLEHQLDCMKTGKFRTHENNGSGWVDTTPSNIARVTENIAELERILADYTTRRI